MADGDGEVVEARVGGSGTVILVTKVHFTVTADVVR